MIVRTSRFPAREDAPYLDIARARRGPFFYIVDREMRVILSRIEGVHAVGEDLPPEIARAAATAVSDPKLAAGEATVCVVRPGLVLRVVLVGGGEGTCYGLFLEPYQQRDLVCAAAKRFALTARETEVLNKLLLGEMTSAIGSKLGIAETTVQQHVKNIGAKVGVTTRREIVAAVLS